MFLEKDVLKICSKFTREHPCRSVISIKLFCSFTEITLRHGCSVNLLHIFRTHFTKNTSGWLLLTNLMTLSWSLLTVVFWFFFLKIQVMGQKWYCNWSIFFFRNVVIFLALHFYFSVYIFTEFRQMFLELSIIIYCCLYKVNSVAFPYCFISYFDPHLFMITLWY